MALLRARSTTGTGVRHETVLGRGTSPWWLLLAACGFAAIAVVAWLLWRDGEDPAEVAEEFLTATSCAELRSLADPDGRVRLTDRACGTLVDAALGKRTYGSPELRTGLERRLRADEPATTGTTALVTLTVTYADGTPQERMVVGLSSDGEEWRVSEWGIVDD